MGSHSQVVHLEFLLSWNNSGPTSQIQKADQGQTHAKDSVNSSALWAIAAHKELEIWSHIQQL